MRLNEYVFSYFLFFALSWKIQEADRETGGQVERTSDDKGESDEQIVIDL